MHHTKRRVSTIFAFSRMSVALLFGLFLTGLIGQASAETKLNIWGSTDTSAFTSLILTFEAQNPDIDIIYHELSSNELYDQVKTTQKKGDEPIDLVISSAIDLQVKLVNDGLASPYVSDATNLVPDWARWRNELFGFTYEPIVLAYNKAAFKGYPLPKSHAELAELIISNINYFKFRVGTYDVNSSGAGYLFFTQDALQSNQIFRLIEALSRAQMRTFGFTAAILDAVASGELFLGYNVIGTYALERAKNDPNLGVLPFKDYTIVMARTAFIYKYSPNRDGAERFLEYLLSDQGQQVIADDSSLIPISPTLRRERLPKDGTNAYLPIKLGVGILTYQDSLKRQSFLEVWNSIFSQSNSD
ncbi:iron(III) transport system substrate-binding protein [Cohaesibacter sp. ES.047]|uniref:ABC transporter substrate-binding protein n=1 Tax=Cohaesibacter sp. ES.047 TaxID=1798205 RepID=UPI000BB97462|nr:ABC transporter substrate-binding protein [Cohaesibacter sp. ES.047]SNY93201.1 iron(III) transport system substrate-binding protein [Cohaesibacter sp. ES.047]